MVIKELGSIDFTDEQIKGLAIEAAVVNKGRMAPDDYLIEQVIGRVNEYVARHIHAAQDARLFDKVQQDRAAAAVALGVDLDIPVPADVALSAEVKP